jgi:hypothetical protein
MGPGLMVQPTPTSRAVAPLNAISTGGSVIAPDTRRPQPHGEALKPNSSSESAMAPHYTTGGIEEARPAGEGDPLRLPPAGEPAAPPAPCGSGRRRLGRGRVDLASRSPIARLTSSSRPLTYRLYPSSAIVPESSAAPDEHANWSKTTGPGRKMLMAGRRTESGTPSVVVTWSEERAAAVPVGLRSIRPRSEGAAFRERPRGRRRLPREASPCHGRSMAGAVAGVGQARLERFPELRWPGSTRASSLTNGTR